MNPTVKELLSPEKIAEIRKAAERDRDFLRESAAFAEEPAATMLLGLGLSAQDTILVLIDRIEALQKREEEARQLLEPRGDEILLASSSWYAQVDDWLSRRNG